MNPAILAALLVQYGPQIIPLVVKLLDDIRAGRTATTVTADDLAELAKLAQQQASDVYARLGITPPPAAVAAAK